MPRHGAAAHRLLAEQPAASGGVTGDEVVGETGRRERRRRDLPAALTLRYVVALALFPSDGYDEVMRQVKVATATTAITRARDRLGVEPVKLLFERTAVAITAATAMRGSDGPTNLDRLNRGSAADAMPRPG